MVLVFIFSCVFFYWVAKKGWYDRIYSSGQGSSDVEKWASYLEQIAVDFPARKRRGELLQEAAKLRFSLNQREKAEHDLVVAESVNPETR